VTKALFGAGRYTFAVPAAGSLAAATLALGFALTVVPREPETDEGLLFLIESGGAACPLTAR